MHFGIISVEISKQTDQSYSMKRMQFALITILLVLPLAQLSVATVTLMDNTLTTEKSFFVAEVANDTSSAINVSNIPVQVPSPAWRIISLQADIENISQGRDVKVIED